MGRTLQRWERLSFAVLLAGIALSALPRGAAAARTPTIHVRFERVPVPAYGALPVSADGGYVFLRPSRGGPGRLLNTSRGTTAAVPPLADCSDSTAAVGPVGVLSVCDQDGRQSAWLFPRGGHGWRRLAAAVIGGCSDPANASDECSAQGVGATWIAVGLSPCSDCGYGIFYNLRTGASVTRATNSGGFLYGAGGGPENLDANKLTLTRAPCHPFSEAHPPSWVGVDRYAVWTPGSAHALYLARCGSRRRLLLCADAVASAIEAGPMLAWACAGQSFAEGYSLDTHERFRVRLPTKVGSAAIYTAGPYLFVENRAGSVLYEARMPSRFVG